MNIKKSAAMLLTGTLAAGLLSCTTAFAEEEDISKHLDLTMYLVGSESRDHDEVMEKVNEILEEKLNCSLTLNYIGFGEYDTKYPLLMSSGETIDLIYAADWCGRAKMVANGAYVDVADLVDEYAPGIAANIDLKEFEKQNNGQLPVIPAYHVGASPYGYIIRGDVMKELGYEEISSLDQYLDFCTDVNNNTEFKDSLCQSLHEYDMMAILIEGYQNISNHEYWMKADDPEHKVYFIGDIPELQDFLKNAAQRAKDGAWSMSVLSNTDSNMMEEGLSAAWIHGLDMYRPMAIKHPDYDLYFNIVIPDEYLTKDEFSGDYMAIPASAQDPKRSLMVLDLLENDRELFDLMTYGIKGKHFDVNEAGQLVAMDLDGFTQENGTWGFRNDDLMYELDGTPEAAIEAKKHFLETAQVNPIVNFTADSDRVKNEYAACENAYNQYYIPLSLGYVDYEEGMAELNSAMEAAGKDKVVAEFQAQIDAYFEAKE